MIKVLMDSAGDLPAEMLAEYDIGIVPVTIFFGTQAFKDRVEIDAETFYRRVAEESRLPTTSQPSPFQFADVYRQTAREKGATDIISVHVSSQLSGTHASSLIAAQEVADEVRVHPFDSRSGSAGQGMMSLEAARMAAANVSVEKIMERLQHVRENMKICLVLDNLKFAQMSGRVSFLAAALSSFLKIKPLVDVRDGMLEVREKARTQRRALDRMFEMVKEQIGDRLANVAVVHAEAPEMANALLERVKQEFRVKEAFIEKLSLGVAVHLGPGTVGLVAYPVE